MPKVPRITPSNSSVVGYFLFLMASTIVITIVAGLKNAVTGPPGPLLRATYPVRHEAKSAMPPTGDVRINYLSK